MKRFRLLALLLVAALAAACSKEPGGPAAAPNSPYALAADPSGGMPVTAALAAAPKEGVVVVGRVRDMTHGLAAFMLIDSTLAYCGQNAMEGCKKPWDYCCYPPGKVRENLISVVVKGKDGNVVPIERIAELRHLDTVVVTGNLTKDKDGNVSLDASGWFRRERPKLPDDLEWPQ